MRELGNRAISITLAVLLLALGACSPVKTIETAGFYPNATNIGDIKGSGSVIQLGDDITISCVVPNAPSFSVMRCVGGFPFTVPPGKIFCMTHMYLQSKYPWEPGRYGGNMHAVYLQEQGVTVSSHHPALHFNPPYPFMAGAKLLGTISNGQTEAQNVIAFEQGFLVNEGQTCKRA